jgi:hypothetical protein
MLSLLDKEIGYLPISPGRNYYGLSEYIAFTLTFRFGIENTYTKRKLLSLAKREKEKYYGKTNFEYVIYYSGMDLMLLHVFDSFGGKKIFNFHDFDMRKYNSSKKYRRNVRYVLKNLEHYSLVIIPSNMKNLEEVKELKDKIRIVVSDTATISIDSILKEAK